MSVTIDTATLQLIAMFEQMSGAQVRDCVTFENQLVFVVEQGEIAKAIGKGGKHARDLEYKSKKNVKIVEFHPDLIQFFQNVIFPLSISQANLKGEVLVVHAKDLKSRGLLIGRSASTLRFFESIVKRYFPIKEIKIA
ncbi:MAG TPA: NusA-like transcription termination signal-binding factor [Candidatus Nanoarchaeia archaeon]|nr:NusA-like transcription termination signal-binding factor [Candidatus Nanoarchaeia archaeon]